MNFLDAASSAGRIVGSATRYAEQTPAGIVPLEGRVAREGGEVLHHVLDTGTYARQLPALDLPSMVGRDAGARGGQIRMHAAAARDATTPEVVAADATLAALSLVRARQDLMLHTSEDTFAGMRDAHLPAIDGAVQRILDGVDLVRRDGLTPAARTAIDDALAEASTYGVQLHGSAIQRGTTLPPQHIVVSRPTFETIDHGRPGSDLMRQLTT